LQTGKIKNASKMETTLLELGMPKVLQKLKEMLIRKGYLVQTMPTSNPVIVAYQEGNWLRSSRQLVLEISSVDNNMTKIDITAIISKKKFNSNAEEVLEENFASSLYNFFKKVIQSPNGI
jgi:ribosomal protein S8